ncbi:MAG: hypothetical protein MK312_04445, partial [Roseibacillus sp.]|nr:hypothetical protein [Roseibacillus sp.]
WAGPRNTPQYTFRSCENGSQPLKCIVYNTTKPNVRFPLCEYPEALSPDVPPVLHLGSVVRDSRAVLA